MKFEAILFDMNGVLIDDEPLHQKAFEHALSDSGIVLTGEHYKEFFAGRTDEEGLSDFLSSIQFKGDAAALLQAKTAYYEELASSGLRAFDGTEDFIQNAVLKGLKLAVVTSATKEEAEASLTTSGLSDYFTSFVTAEDVKVGKPSPEAYLIAAKELEVKPEDCLVIEDAPSGVLSAKRAGMYCVAVTNTHTAPELQEADEIVDRLDNSLVS